MPSQTRNAAASAIDTAARYERPYLHLVVGDLFDEDDAEAVLSWLERDARWWAQERDFYQHDTCENMASCPMVSAGGILGPEVRVAMAEALERRLGVPLDRKHPTLGAHRMRPGHGIGIHSDSPELGTEHVRLLVTLRRGRFADEEGGHLLLLERPALDATGAILRPIHNSAVAFVLEPGSYHAVNDVTAGERYSLVFGFWNREQMRTSSIPERSRGGHVDGEIDGLPRSAELLAALRAAGAASVGHSGATLLDHLVGVAALLVDWDCDEHVCRAGLFHSVYGTATFSQALFSEADREMVRHLVGPRAERLAWLFSTVRFSEVYRRTGEQRYHARRRDDGATVELDRADIAELNLIACANMFEQLPAEDLSPGDLFEWRTAIDNLADILPERALTTMRAVFGETEGRRSSLGDEDRT